MSKIVIIILFLIVSSHANADKHGSKAYVEQSVKDMPQKSNNKKLMDESTCHVETIFANGLSIHSHVKCSEIEEIEKYFQVIEEVPND